jgi:8-oxo-dGTP diphosphatase
MAFDDKFRLSSHAVVTDSENRVLLLKASYGDFNWGLPGGALDCGETIHQALVRECKEELDCDIKISYLSGVYYHSAFNSQAFIFRCSLEAGREIKLSEEHTEFRYCALDDMSKVQRQRVEGCLNYSGDVVSARF